MNTCAVRWGGPNRPGGRFPLDSQLVGRSTAEHIFRAMATDIARNPPGHATLEANGAIAETFAAPQLDSPWSIVYFERDRESALAESGDQAHAEEVFQIARGLMSPHSRLELRCGEVIDAVETNAAGAEVRRV